MGREAEPEPEPEPEPSCPASHPRSLAHGRGGTSICAHSRAALPRRVRWWLCISAHSRLSLAVVRRARWWLCASENDQANCLPSKDFSEYYKRPVFVCQVA